MAGIALFFHKDLAFQLEGTGIALGLLVTVAGFLGFVAGRRNVKAESRHKLFILALVSGLLASLSLIAMFVLCVLWTHFRYEDVRDRANRLNGDQVRDLPYVFSLEGSSHMAHLRAVAASFYLLTLLLFVVSIILNAINIRKNKANIHTNGAPYQPVAKGETIIYNNQKNAVSTKEDLPWIDQN